MDRKERAKQFAPFDALKGLQDELRKREARFIYKEKKDLSEDAQEEICANLEKIRGNSRIIVDFYYNGQYLCLEGDVVKNNKNKKYIQIGEEKIYYDDIFQIRIISI